MLPFVLMAQLNSEKFSQGCPSLQYSGSPAKVCLAARSFFLQVFQLSATRDARAMAIRGGSAQVDFRAARGNLPQIASAEVDMRSVLKTVFSAGCSQENFAETRATEYRGALPRIKNDDRGCFGSLCCKGFRHAAMRCAGGVVVV